MKLPVPNSCLTPIFPGLSPVLWESGRRVTGKTRDDGLGARQIWGTSPEGTPEFACPRGAPSPG
jgi:hypothetical protein